MPVDSVHEDYSRASQSWALVRDCVAGERTVKKKGALYLPRLAEQGGPDYDKYLFRARFFNVTGRTLEAFVGFIYNKDPKFTHPPVLDEFVLDATSSGTSFYAYSKTITEEATAIGRGGTLIDWNEIEARAYVTRYNAEDILNWDTTRIKGRTYLSLLVLRDRVKVRGAVADIFVHPAETHYRVYQLLEMGADFYIVNCTVLRRMADSNNPKPPPHDPSPAALTIRRAVAVLPGSDNFEVVDQFQPKRRGRMLERIPFEFHNSTNGDACVGKVPMEDLASTNISHYLTTADLERGRHIAGNPTLFLKGMNLKGTDQIHVGSPMALTSESPNADGKYIEFTGQGLGALEKAVEEKKQDMAHQGARMLESQTSSAGAEAFETVQMRQSGEASVLVKIALACSESLSRVMQTVLWWHGTAASPDELEKECNVRLNTEFLQLNIDPAMLSAVTAAYQSNSISYEEYFYFLKRGKLIRDDTTIEIERKALTQSPVLELLMAEQKQQQQSGGAAK